MFEFLGTPELANARWRWIGDMRSALARLDRIYNARQRASRVLAERPVHFEKDLWEAWSEVQRVARSLPEPLRPASETPIRFEFVDPPVNPSRWGSRLFELVMAVFYIMIGAAVLIAAIAWARAHWPF